METLNNKKLARKLAKKCRQNVSCHLNDKCAFNITDTTIIYCDAVLEKHWYDFLNMADKVRGLDNA